MRLMPKCGFTVRFFKMKIPARPRISCRHSTSDSAGSPDRLQAGTDAGGRDRRTGRPVRASGLFLHRPRRHEDAPVFNRTVGLRDPSPRRWRRANTTPQRGQLIAIARRIDADIDQRWAIGFSKASASANSSGSCPPTVQASHPMPRQRSRNRTSSNGHPGAGAAGAAA